MSFHYYPAGVFGIRVEDLFPADLAKEISAAYCAAMLHDDEELIEGLAHDTEEPVYKERYRRVMQRHQLSEFEDDPGDLVRIAFGAECEKYIPGYRKMFRFAGFYRVDGDAMTCDDCEEGDVLFGIGVYQFPLERNFKRAKVPAEFSEKARMMLWVVGG